MAICKTPRFTGKGNKALGGRGKAGSEAQDSGSTSKSDFRLSRLSSLLKQTFQNHGGQMVLEALEQCAQSMNVEIINSSNPDALQPNYLHDLSNGSFIYLELSNFSTI